MAEKSPKRVRNFWLELQVDGRRLAVKTGPRRKEGGFRLAIKIRDRGSVRWSGTLEGRATGETLELLWYPQHSGDTDLQLLHTTER